MTRSKTTLQINDVLVRIFGVVRFRRTVVEGSLWPLMTYWRIVHSQKSETEQSEREFIALSYYKHIKIYYRTHLSSLRMDDGTSLSHGKCFSMQSTNQLNGRKMNPAGKKFIFSLDFSSTLHLSPTAFFLLEFRHCLTLLKLFCSSALYWEFHAAPVDPHPSKSVCSAIVSKNSTKCLRLVR